MTHPNIICLHDASILDASGLPAPEVIAEEIPEILQSAVQEIQAVLDALNADKDEEGGQ